MPTGHGSYQFLAAIQTRKMRFMVRVRNGSPMGSSVIPGSVRRSLGGATEHVLANAKMAVWLAH